MSNSSEEKRVANKNPDVILGVDLNLFHKKSNLSLTQARRILGVSLPKWKKESSKSTAISDVTLSMLLRLYNENPQLLPKNVSIRDFYHDIGGRSTVSPADFSLIMGRESSAYTRWLSGTSDVSPTLENLINVALRLSDGNAKEAFGLIKSLYQKEALARNVDPMRDRRWTGSRVEQRKVRGIRQSKNGASK